MKLKYYLRGLGVGIIITVILMMIGFSSQKNSISDEEVIERARNLGMVMKDEQVSGLKDAKKQETDQETKQPEDTTQGAENNEAKDADAPAEGDDKINGQQPGTDGEPAGTEGGEGADVPDEGAGSQGEGATGSQGEGVTGEPEYIPVEVAGGEYSDKISQKLHAAQLIDDPDAFNRYLVESGIDSQISVGVHNIPKGATPEEIAQILCEKPESPQ